MMKRIKILNIEIDNITQGELLKDITQGILVTPNVDDLIKSQRDKEFYEFIRKATHTVCDSKIVLFASKILGTPLREAVSGSDFFPAFYTYHAKNEKIKIFLLGGKEEVGKKAKTNINKKVGREVITDFYSPPWGFEKDSAECQKIIQILRGSNANVVAVCLGNPKQTKWIFNYKEQLPNIDLFLALGATVDFEAGVIKRAPIIYRKLALEWLYRMFIDPKRLIKRYLIDDLPFIYYIFLQRIGLYRNPFE
jgi:exopolysaccharide biosynthesis WecB/TagA/CpsF family protein